MFPQILGSSVGHIGFTGRDGLIDFAELVKYSDFDGKNSDLFLSFFSKIANL